ncbi:hypothetical protein KEM52_005420 [Ascosphaera acerosa]|nr:hypothetical protein KEM52_005420 [Ascosphaera acerosa]
MDHGHQHEKTRAARLAHVNLMTDTVILNLEASAMKSILRAMLASDKSGEITRSFNAEAQAFFRRSHQAAKAVPPPQFFARPPLTPCSEEYVGTSSGSGSGLEARSRPGPTSRPVTVPLPALGVYRSKCLAMVGCGLAFDSLPIYADIIEQVRTAVADEAKAKIGGDASRDDEADDDDDDDDELSEAIIALDHELVQALTAVQKLVPIRGEHATEISESQECAIIRLRDCLAAYYKNCDRTGQEFLLERSSEMVDAIISALG